MCYLFLGKYKVELLNQLMVKVETNQENEKLILGQTKHTNWDIVDYFCGAKLSGMNKAQINHSVSSY